MTVRSKFGRFRHAVHVRTRKAIVRADGARRTMSPVGGRREHPIVTGLKRGGIGWRVLVHGPRSAPPAAAQCTSDMNSASAAGVPRGGTSDLAPAPDRRHEKPDHHQSPGTRSIIFCVPFESRTRLISSIATIRAPPALVGFAASATYIAQPRLRGPGGPTPSPPNDSRSSAIGGGGVRAINRLWHARVSSSKRPAPSSETCAAGVAIW